jgi:gamma-glutamylcyclotransferase
MRERCPESKPLFIATLPNYKLVFAGWSRQWRGGMASIKLHHGEKVMGGVYELTEQDLRKLDRYEGCPGAYNRLKVMVFDEDGNQVEAVTYIKSGQLDETPPTKEYVAVIQQGYKDWEIDR